MKYQGHKNVELRYYVILERLSTQSRLTKRLTEKNFDKLSAYLKVKMPGWKYINSYVDILGDR